MKMPSSVPPDGGKAGFRFTKNLHIRKNDDFQLVYKRRCSLSDERFIIYARANDLTHARLGLSVSRKVGNAVVRNRIRRKLREAFRLGRGELPAGLDLVIIPRSGADFTLTQASESLQMLVPRLARRLTGKERKP